MRPVPSLLTTFMAISCAACGLTYQQRQDRFREHYTTGCQIIRNPPNPNPNPSDSEGFGALEQSEIEQVVDRSQDEVQACYLEAHELWPRLDGHVAIKFEILPNGAVGNTALALYNSSIAEASVGCCVVRIARTWQFPEPRGGKHIEAEYPVVLTTDPFKIKFPATSKTGQPQPASGTEIHFTW